MVITATEGAQLPPRRSLRRRPGDFDPMTSATASSPAPCPARAYLQAQRFRTAFRARMARASSGRSTSSSPRRRRSRRRASASGRRSSAARPSSTQPYLGVYTQPISFAGLPVLTVPVATVDGLPLGVQLIGGHDREDRLLRVAAELEARGLARVAEGAMSWR